MFRVIGVENVAPGVVTQSPVFHAPDWHAQLESCTATDLSLATRRSFTSSPIWLKLYASTPTLGMLPTPGAVLVYRTECGMDADAVAAVSPRTATASSPVTRGRRCTRMPPSGLGVRMPRLG